MAQTSVRTPSGEIITVQHPDGATDDDILNYAKQNAASGVNAADDLLKSAAIGPANAAVGTLGAIPDFTSMLHGAANKYLFDPALRAVGATPTSDLPKIPEVGPDLGSANIRQNIEKVTGPFYKPQTEDGKYAESITSNMTGALAGPGGLGMKAAQGIGGGLGSEYLGSKFEGTALEPWMRALGGIGGGVAASAGGKTLEAVQNAAAARSTGAEIGNIIGGGDVKGAAVRRVGQNVADDELTPASVSARSQQLGPDAMLLDQGQQLENRADFMAQHSGKAQNTIHDAVSQRVNEGAAGRLNDVLDQHLGSSRDVVDLQDKIQQISDRYVKPAYQALEQKYPVVVDAQLQELAKRPAIAQAMDRAEGVAANYGEQISGAQPSIRYWDYVKKSLDQRINTMMRSGMDDLSSQQKADLGGLIDSKKSLVKHLDSVTGGEYAQARTLATTKPAMDEALDFGRSMFGNKLLPEQIKAHFDDLSAPEQEMVKIGARREIERLAGAPGDEGRKLRNFLSGNNNQQKLETLLGAGPATEIKNQLLAEDQFQGVANKIAGTRTATRIAGMNDTQAPVFNQSPTVLGVAAAVPRMGINAALEHGMANTRQDISRILTTPSDKISPVVEQLLNYNRARAANASAPFPQQAATLIRALVSGGTGRR